MREQCIPLIRTFRTAATLYYVYAYMNSGTLTLEAVTTGHVLNSSTGLQQKSGDATRTFIGWVYMGSGSPGTFVDTAASRTVKSYFNRSPAALQGAATAGATTTSTSYAEIASGSRAQCIADGIEGVCISVSGNGSVAAASGARVQVNIGQDGISTVIAPNDAVISESGSNFIMTLHSRRGNTFQRIALFHGYRSGGRRNRHL